MEYLVTMTTHVPGGTSEATVEDIRTREAARSREVQKPSSSFTRIAVTRWGTSTRLMIRMLFTPLGTP